MELVKIVRSTRGKGSRPVEFDGYQTEVPSGEFTKPRDGSEPEAVMVDCPDDDLPSQSEAMARLTALFDGADAKIRRALAKTCNAVAFSLQVAATATVVEDLLSPVFAEFNITDEAVITKLRRALSTNYGSLVDMGRIAKDLPAEVQAEKKIKLLRRMLSEADI